MLHLRWIKSQNDTWLPLETVNLAGVNALGVYIIWHKGQPGKVVRVGQGDIADRIIAHRKDPAVLAYRDRGLLVTWAAVPAHQRDGVERYLADHWQPLIGDRFPTALPLAVNSPFAA